jgi:hypothetical protein
MLLSKLLSVPGSPVGDALQAQMERSDEKHTSPFRSASGSPGQAALVEDNE